jgi:hypothetical protein
VLNQLYEFGNADGTGPPNNDPREGTADTDGDGAMNFVDADNDGDSIPDATEESRGSHLNLVTPTLSALDPSTVTIAPPLATTLTGLHFDPAMSVFLDGMPLVPADVTATSATLQPPLGRPAGSYPVYVELPNGERSLDQTLTILASPPAGALPSFTDRATVSLGVRGTAKLVVGNGQVYAVDTGEDGTTDTTVNFDLLGNPSGGTPPQIAVNWGSDGHLIGIRCVPTPSGCQIQVIRDADADLVLTDAGGDDVILGPSYTTTAPNLWGPSVQSDPSGNLVAGYVFVNAAGSGEVTVLHDRDGDGSFSAGAPETVVIQNLFVTPGNFGKLAVDPSGRVAYAYVATGPLLRIAYDRNGDGDFTDGGETFTAFDANAPHSAEFCGGVAFDAAGRLAATFGESIAAQVRVFRDLNGDGDFADAGDVASVIGDMTSACDVAGHPSGGLAVAHGGGGAPDGLKLLVDRNGDGDFADANEEVGLASEATRLGVAFSGVGRAWLASTAGVFGDPF